ncbi:histidine acid phosphatase [Coniella lustricola]|uniref:3-phytase n=1 Tax=Coniella lustricola TaxID=2025994 RepID=A0A2T3A672_9PEZI|nr:histidine acid phosphatase [Coniella lustricola]
MTTLQVRKPYTQDELRQLYPPELQLQQVQILLRHGERTPVAPRFQNAGLQGFWPYCTAVRHLRDAVLERGKDGKGEVFSTLEWKRRLETFGAADDSPVVASGPAGELDSVCDMGMLTDTGRLTTLQLGERLRGLYVDRLGFLPKTIDSADFIYLRTTPVPRSMQSLQQAFTGLYPTPTRGPNFPPPTILTRALSDETLLPNDGHCRRFAILARAFGQRTADRWNGTDDMAYLTKLIGKWMPEAGPQQVAVDSKPRLSGIMDTINATLAHGPETRLPKEFYDPKAREIIDKIGVEEWFGGYKESEEYRKLGVGGLLGDITARMVGSVEHSLADGQYEIMRTTGPNAGQHRAVKFGMSCAHDTTLAGALTSLGAFDGYRWPPFTSHIAFELFRKADGSGAGAAESNKAEVVPVVKASPSTSSWFSSLFSSGAPAGQPPSGIGRKPTEELSHAEKLTLDGYYVRIRYNDEIMKVPGCKAPGKHYKGDDSLCTLAAFKSVVDKFTPQDWKDECKKGKEEPVFPAQIQPPGY